MLADVKGGIPLPLSCSRDHLRHTVGKYPDSLVELALPNYPSVEDRWQALCRQGGLRWRGARSDVCNQMLAGKLLRGPSSVACASAPVAGWRTPGYPWPIGVCARHDSLFARCGLLSSALVRE